MSSRTAPGVKRAPINRGPRGTSNKGPSSYSSSVMALNQTASKAASSGVTSSSSSLPYGSSSSSASGAAAAGSDGAGASNVTSPEMGSPGNPEIPRLGVPMVLTPVSQISGGTRRMSRTGGPMRPEDNPSTYDPINYNADGSLKTMHTLPNFDKSYAEARKARYCRPREPNERDTELTIQQIFDKK